MPCWLDLPRELREKVLRKAHVLATREMLDEHLQRQLLNTKHVFTAPPFRRQQQIWRRVAIDTHMICFTTCLDFHSGPVVADHVLDMIYIMDDNSVHIRLTVDEMGSTKLWLFEAVKLWRRSGDHQFSLYEYHGFPDACQWARGRQFDAEAGL